MSGDLTLQHIRTRMSRVDPIRPRAGAWTVASVVFPWCFVVAVASFSFYGWSRATWERPATHAAGLLLALSVAYLILVLVRQESTPGQARGWQVLAAAGGFAIGLQLLLDWADSFGVAETTGARGGSALLFCASVRLLSGSLLIGLVLWWNQTGLSWRPGAIGALGGIAAGLAVDAVWRLQCGIPHLDHGLVGHTGALLLMALLCGGCGRTLTQWSTRKLRV